MSELCVVIPVFNEERAIRGVAEEWLAELRKLEIDFRMVVVNDGSTDKTLSELQSLLPGNRELQIIDKPNTGHADSCFCGYRLAVNDGDQWIFQIDSDGQCDPKFFREFWLQRKEELCTQGYRATRDDGFVRMFISRLLSIAVYTASGTYVRDLNVPYRLMHRRTLAQAVELVPPLFPLANILLSYIYQKYFGIQWIDINFRDRWFGSSKTNLPKMLELACSFFSAFARTRPEIEAKRQALTKQSL